MCFNKNKSATGITFLCCTFTDIGKVRNQEMWPLLLLLLVDGAWAECSEPVSGLWGKTACIDFSATYTSGQHQWATCLTSAYIQQKSGYTHRCADQADYCWYTCMLEVHERQGGDVFSNCSCDPNDNSPTKTPSIVLPAWCYKPPSDACDWYRNCIEKKYPCEATTNAYALAFAEKFCNLYNDHFSKFTSDRRKWIDAVRKCLQLSLVPMLRSPNNPTCQQIRSKAFGSHSPCYLAPDKGAPSICDLKWSEYLKIFWIMKGSFVSLDTAGETLKGLWNVGRRCIASQSTKLTKVTKLTVQKFTTRPKRSTDAIAKSDLRQRFADRVCLAIAQSLKWDKKGMDWFGFYDENTDTSDADISTISLILADTKSLGLNTNPSTDQVNLDDTVQQLVTAIKEGKLPLQVDGAYVWPKSLQYCGETACNSTQTKTESDKLPKWGARGGASLCYSSTLVLSFLALVLNVLETGPWA